jgi:hypothetical protein
MSFNALRNRAVQVVAAAATLLAVGQASAFTVSDLPPTTGATQPSIAVFHEGIDTPKIDHVWCRWGCRGGFLLGGLAAGALIGGALAGGPYGYGPGYYGGGPYYGYGGGPYGGYGGPGPYCWRSVWTAYGWRRVWVC